MATSVSGVGDAYSQLGQKEYLQLLVAQLQNQDPMEPVKDTDFIAQLAQFSSLQGQQELNSRFEVLLQYEQLGQGSGLLGKKVQYQPDGQAAAATGLVEAVRVEADGIALTVGGVSVPLAQIKAVLPAS